MFNYNLCLSQKQKTAAYYKTRTSELDPKLLSVIPDCPRSAKESFAANFDWSMLSAIPIIGSLQNGMKKVEKLSTKLDQTNESDDPKIVKQGGNKYRLLFF